MFKSCTLFQQCLKDLEKGNSICAGGRSEEQAWRAENAMHQAAGSVTTDQCKMAAALKFKITSPPQTTPPSTPPTLTDWAGARTNEKQCCPQNTFQCL